MIPTLKVKTAAFGIEIERIIKVTGKSAQQVIREEGKLFVADVVKQTPPFSGYSSSESFNAQRKVGEAAAERDVHRVFDEIDLSRIRDVKIRDRVEKLVKRGDTEGIEKILKNLKIPVRAVVKEADPALHQAARDSRGRVPKARSIWVLKGASLKRYIKSVREDVGKAKAGWEEAARALGVKLPGWITRHSSPGLFEDQTSHPTKPKIVVGNAVDYIQASGAQLRIVELALQRRITTMRAKLVRIAKSGWRKK